MLDLPVGLQFELLGRLLLSVLLGGVLGWERQMGQHPAGLRTHVLVALGAAAYTLAGTYGVSGQGTVQDAGRIAAQIVTGIGFLGAGTIWRSGSDRVIYGLTTAASIWVAASIGMLVGFGQYVLAAGCAILGFTTLRLMKGMEELPSKLSVKRFRRSSSSSAARAGRTTTDLDESDHSSVTINVLSDDTSDQPDSTLDPSGPHALPALPPAAPAKRNKTNRKKNRKRKRRDTESDTEALISDAPPP